MLLVAAFWPGLAGATALGLVVGGLAGWPARAAVPLALCALTAVLTAAAWLAPGRPGLWLEGAGLVLPPYLAGCVLGALLRRLVTHD